MEGTYVYLWLTRVDVWQKPTQCCKAIILQLKTNLKELVSEENTLLIPYVYITSSKNNFKTYKLS